MLRRMFFRNFQSIYRFDHWFRTRFTPAGKLLLGVWMAAITFGIDTRQTLAYQIVAFLTALLLLAMLSRPRAALRLRIQRDLPAVATVHEPLYYRMRISNAANRPLLDAQIKDVVDFTLPNFNEFQRLAKGLHGRASNWFDRYVGYPNWLWLLYTRKGVEIEDNVLAELAAHGEAELRVPLRPVRRGMIYFTAVEISRADPLGLFRGIAVIPARDHLLVLPKRYPVPALRLPGGRKYQRGGVSLAMSVGDSEEFLSLRDYRPGDPLRHIHWNSWAKLNKPVVKEFQDEFFVRHALVLDTFVHNLPLAQFEEAVSVAASFAGSILNQDTLLDVLFVGNQAYAFTGGRGLAHLDQFLRILACVEGCYEERMDKLQTLLLQYTSALSGAIVVLLAWDATRQALVDQLRALQLPMLVVVLTQETQPQSIPAYPYVHFLRMSDIAGDLAQLG